jgi:DNA polymerase
VKQVMLGVDFNAWRTAAREALHSGFRPEDIDFQDGTVPTPLSLALEADEAPHGPPMEHPRVTRQFLEVAQVVAVHRDPARWNLLYRVLYRLQSEPELLKIETDDDVTELLRLKAQVQRDLHRMQAFVQFRKVLEPGTPGERPVVVDEPVLVGAEAGEEHHLVLLTPTPFGPVEREIEGCAADSALGAGAEGAECEHFVAWYQPEHRILPMAAPFFAERFAILRWTILTPDASVTWDPAQKKLTFGAGVPFESAPAEDELEALWRSYYASLYDRARLNSAERDAAGAG